MLYLESFTQHCVYALQSCSFWAWIGLTIALPQALRIYYLFNSSPPQDKKSLTQFNKYLSNVSSLIGIVLEYTNNRKSLLITKGD